MRVALILAGNIWFAPYVRNYTRLLDLHNVDYSIISWNRDGRDKKEGFQFFSKSFDSTRSATFYEYAKYVRFIKKIIYREQFDKLIIFGPQISCLLSSLLVKWKGKYIIDYRDLSIEQRVVFKQVFSLLVKRSFACVISSPGFLRCLPSHDYYISHNFDVEAVLKALEDNSESGFFVHDVINVLTIGGIRDYSSNIEVIKSLANRDSIICKFVGKGIAEGKIKDYCKNNCINNVCFEGFYNKEDEPAIIKEATFMNIFYPRIVTHDTAMSNRFYNSLIYKRPMIVTKGTTQGNFAEKNALGVAITDGVNLEDKLKAFLNTSFSEYSKRCNDLLRLFMKDQEAYEKMLVDFIN